MQRIWDFSPHKDYRVAKEIFGEINLFGDVNEKDCPSEYSFGKDGKPLYVARPSDTPQRYRRVVDTLMAKCGPGGFYFEAPL